MGWYQSQSLPIVAQPFIQWPLLSLVIFRHFEDFVELIFKSSYYQQSVTNRDANVLSELIVATISKTRDILKGFRSTVSCCSSHVELRCFLQQPMCASNSWRIHWNWWWSTNKHSQKLPREITITFLQSRIIYKFSQPSTTSQEKIKFHHLGRTLLFRQKWLWEEHYLSICWHFWDDCTWWAIETSGETNLTNVDAAFLSDIIGRLSTG